MSEIAEQNMRQTGKVTKAVLDCVRRLLLALAEYLEKNAKTSAQKEMAKFIRNGGGIYAYSIQGDRIAGTIPALKAELDARGIPYLSCNEKATLFIRGDDLEAIREINRDILIAKGNYFQEVDASALENAIAGANFVKDKNIFTLYGLDEYQAECIKNKCNNITSGFMIGTTRRMDGTVDISVRADTIVDQDKNFLRAYLQAAVSLYGPNHDLKVAQIEADRKTDDLIASLKGTETTHYVVGADDHTKYIELTREDFIYHELRTGKDGRVVDDIHRCPCDDPDYEIELQVCMDRIMNREVIDDAELLQKHLTSNKRVIPCTRPEKDKDAYEYALTEKDFAAELDSILQRRLDAKGITDPAERFAEYVDGAQTLIAACTGKTAITPEFDKQDVQTLKEVFEKHNVSVEKFRDLEKAFEVTTCRVHTAKIERTQAR